MRDFAACLKTLNKLLKLMMIHPEDQEVLAKDDLRLIVIYFMPNVWQQEFEWNSEKNTKQMIRLVLTYFRSQQSFKDQLKHILAHPQVNPQAWVLPKYNMVFASLKAIVKMSREHAWLGSIFSHKIVYIVEVEDNHVMHQETKRD